MLRSMHTMDVPFVFYNHAIAESEIGPAAGTAALAEKMSATFVQFAKTGNPDNKTIPHWPAYDPSIRQTMVWNTEPKVVNDPFGAEKAAIAATPREESAGRDVAAAARREISPAAARCRARG